MMMMMAMMMMMMMTIRMRMRMMMMMMMMTRMMMTMKTMTRILRRRGDGNYFRSLKAVTEREMAPRRTKKRGKVAPLKTTPKNMREERGKWMTENANAAISRNGLISFLEFSIERRRKFVTMPISR